jgi:hypothetical protein
MDDVIVDSFPDKKMQEMTLTVWKLLRAWLTPSGSQREAADVGSALLLSLPDNPHWVKMAPGLIPLLAAASRTSQLYHDAPTSNEELRKRLFGAAMANALTVLFALHSEMPGSPATIGEFARRVVMAEM